MASVGDHTSKQVSLRNLQVTHREALALLSALELSPFEDETLEQKLLDMVYRDRHSPRVRARRDVTHHRR